MFIRSYPFDYLACARFANWLPRCCNVNEYNPFCRPPARAFYPLLCGAPLQLHHVLCIETSKHTRVHTHTGSAVVVLGRALLNSLIKFRAIYQTFCSRTVCGFFFFFLLYLMAWALALNVYTYVFLPIFGVTSTPTTTLGIPHLQLNHNSLDTS